MFLHLCWQIFGSLAWSCGNIVKNDNQKFNMRWWKHFVQRLAKQKNPVCMPSTDNCTLPVQHIKNCAIGVVKRLFVAEEHLWWSNLFNAWTVSVLQPHSKRQNLVGCTCFNRRPFSLSSSWEVILSPVAADLLSSFLLLPHCNKRTNRICQCWWCLHA